MLVHPEPLVSIVIPAYNEEAAIGADIATIRETMEASAIPWELIVVDDGSRDRTGEIAEAAGALVLRHSYNKGTGGARTTGVRYARGEIIVMTDADGTYPNQDIPRLLETLQQGFDMVIGARRKERGTLRWLRTPAKELIRRLASFMTGSAIPDLNSGLRAFRRDVALRFLGILPNSHSWVSTITLAMLSNGYRVAYEPIDYYPRVGKSTFHPIRDTYNYISLLFRTLTYFNPLKIFLPVSVLLAIVGLAKLLYDNFVLLDIRESDVIILVVAVLIAMLGMLADLIVAQNRHRYLAPPRLQQPPADGRPRQH